MRLGIFFEVPVASHQSVADRYADTLEQACLAEHLGFDTVWLAEHHFHGPGSNLPNPWVFAGAVAVRTRRIGIGTAISILPLHQPLLLAAEVGMVDALSRGRTVLGIGRGSSRYDGPPLGVSPDSVDARFTDGLELVERAWAREELELGGREVVVAPQPVQRPRPPILIAARSATTVERAARHGYGLLLDAADTLESVRDSSRCYRDGFTRGLDGDPSVRMLMLVHPRGGSLPDFYGSVSHYLRSRNDSSDPREWVRRTNGLVGDPECVAETATRIASECGVDEVICWFDPGGQVAAGDVLTAMCELVRSWPRR